MPQHPSYFRLKSSPVLLLCLFLALSACGSLPDRHTKAPTFSFTGKKGPQQLALSKFFKAWKSAPYKLGGLDKSGVDCSGFVHLTYRDVFKRTLPRSTELQAKTGTPVAQKTLKFGDLVFFKTGRKQRHVGIYIDNGKFIHASSSRGVMQSSLRSSYWSQHYWKAKRIL